MRNLYVNVKLLQQPLEGDNFSFTINKNGQPIVYDTTNLTSVNKIYTNNPTIEVGRITKANTSDLSITQENFKSFNISVRSTTEINGDLLVVGQFTTYDSILRNCVVRLSVNGDFIQSYGSFVGSIDVVKFHNNKIYLGGDFASSLGSYYIRLNTDGTPDTAFNNAISSNGGFNGRVSDIAILPENRQIVVGEFTLFNGLNNRALVCLNENGSIYTAFNSNRPTNGRINTVTTDGFRIWLGGTFTNWSGRDYIQCMTSPLGALTNPNITITGDIATNEVLVVYKTGSHLYIGGKFAKVNDEPRVNLAKVLVGQFSNLTPVVDADFDTSTNLDGVVRAINSDFDDLLVGGDFNQYGVEVVGRFIKLNTNAEVVGKIVFNNNVRSIFRSGSGFLIIGGDFTQITNGSSVGINFIPIGTDYVDTGDNTESNLFDHNNRSDITVTRFNDSSSGSLIEIVGFNLIFDDSDIVTVTNINQVLGRVEIEILNESLNLQDITSDIRVRSPFLFKADGSDFDTTNFKIWAYRGNIFNYTTLDPIYTKTKQKISPTQEEIYFNVSELVKEKLESDIQNYVNSPQTIQSLNLENNKWVRVESTNFLLGEDTEEDKFNFYFITDGYKDYSEVSSAIPNILSTSKKKYFNINSRARLHFKTNYLLEITVEDGLLSYSIDATTPIGESTEWVKSIGLNSFTSDKVRLFFTYQQGTEIVELDIDKKCGRYDVIDLVFKNKYGVLETLSFSKVSKSTLDVEKSSYNRSIVDFNGNLNMNRHTKKDFNVSGMTSVVLNTDWIPEYMNESFQELMLSEEVYMVERITQPANLDTGSTIGGSSTRPTQYKTTPVNLKDSSFSFKKKINDKLINYTVNIEISHNQVQNFI